MILKIHLFSVRGSSKKLTCQRNHWTIRQRRKQLLKPPHRFRNFSYSKKKDASSSSFTMEQPSTTSLVAIVPPLGIGSIGWPRFKSIMSSLLPSLQSVSSTATASRHSRHPQWRSPSEAQRSLLNSLPPPLPPSSCLLSASTTFTTRQPA